MRPRFTKIPNISYIRTSLLLVLVAREISISFHVDRKSKEREKSHYRHTVSKSIVRIFYPIFLESALDKYKYKYK